MASAVRPASIASVLAMSASTVSSTLPPSIAAASSPARRPAMRVPIAWVANTARSAPSSEGIRYGQIGLAVAIPNARAATTPGN